MKSERQVILFGILASQFTVQQYVYAFQSTGPILLPNRNKMMIRPDQWDTMTNIRARYYQPSLLFTSFIQEPPLSAEMEEEEEDHSSSSSLSSSSLEMTEEVLVRRDIEAMRQEAIQRLEALSEQIEIVKHDCEAARLRKKNELTAERLEHQHQPQEQPQPPPVEGLREAQNVFSLDCLEGDQTRQPMYSEMKTTHSKSPSSSAHVRDEDEVDRYDLLEDTRWKIVFNIGREPGTWMPATWGKSGDRVRFQVVVDFTDETYYQREDFFQGFATTTTTAPATAGSTTLSSSVVGAKVLKVVQAFVIPTGVGSQSTGRIPIQVQPTGAYKVLKGQGPMGTDIVRLFIDLLQEVHRGDDKGSSDVHCPAGRVYATCGYFPMHPAKASDRHSWKDILAEEQHAILMRYEQLQMEMEQDDRLFSWDKIQRMKEMYQVKKQLTQVTQRLQEARQREPERSQLRLSLDGTVALSKEGGVCCKVHKGFAVEYHILGRMEVGCIDHDREEHDEYDELVHKLHP